MALKTKIVLALALGLSLVPAGVAQARSGPFHTGAWSNTTSLEDASRGFLSFEFPPASRRIGTWSTRMAILCTTGAYTESDGRYHPESDEHGMVNLYGHGSDTGSIEHGNLVYNLRASRSGMEAMRWTVQLEINGANRSAEATLVVAGHRITSSGAEETDPSTYRCVGGFTTHVRWRTNRRLPTPPMD